VRGLVRGQEGQVPETAGFDAATFVTLVIQNAKFKMQTRSSARAFACCILTFALRVT
jgi:hypothetical protein